ncbi:cytochrome P450 71D11-like protein [Tanacetum coccineum]
MWWKDPDKFHLERFLNSSTNYRGLHFEYIPFGAGRRVCPGMSFGLANVELPLIKLIYHFDWKLPNGITCDQVDMNESFGVMVRRKTSLHLIPTVYHPLAA